MAEHSNNEESQAPESKPFSQEAAQKDQTESQDQDKSSEKED